MSSRKISIHASRGGSDPNITTMFTCWMNFNPRFPRGKRPGRADEQGLPADFNPRFPRGKRQRAAMIAEVLAQFQSTLPAGEATALACPVFSIHSYFNPRFPRGKRRIRLIENAALQEISIHASRGGSDQKTAAQQACMLLFQSTLPAGEATRAGACRRCAGPISIHASRGGSDPPSVRPCCTPRKYFNPRFPRGKRPSHVNYTPFQFLISIHASRGGSDLRRGGGKRPPFRFQSTLPAGEATYPYFNYFKEV